MASPLAMDSCYTRRMPRTPPPAQGRPLGLRLIIAYKLSKGPAMLLLAAWLTFAPLQALGVEHRLAADLLEWGALLQRLGRWLQLHVDAATLRASALVAWLDGASTLLEGVLLQRGYAWGEWLVVAGASALVPLELWALARHPSPLRAALLAVNVAIALYLVRRRLAHAA
jgi:uncharacterized membrane protein (DUF2068 family)